MSVCRVFLSVYLLFFLLPSFPYVSSSPCSLLSNQPPYFKYWEFQVPFLLPRKGLYYQKKEEKKITMAHLYRPLVFHFYNLINMGWAGAHLTLSFHSTSFQSKLPCLASLFAFSQTLTPAVSSVLSQNTAKIESSK